MVSKHRIQKIEAFAQEIKKKAKNTFRLFYYLFTPWLLIQL